MNQNSFMRHAGACITAMLFTAVAQADGGLSHGPQTSHVHGSAQLNVVKEGRLVHIELISPAANLVGFEHDPVSEAEHAAQQRAYSTLEDAERLFRFDKAADCRAEQTEIEPEATLAVQPTDEDEHHHYEAGDDEHGNERHADITATYRFLCKAPEGPARLRVGLFDAFPAVENLVVQYVTGDRQGGTTLNSSEPVLSF